MFASLRRCAECGPHTRAEIYMGSIWGRMVFLPGLPLDWLNCGGWALDLESLQVRLGFWDLASGTMSAAEISSTAVCSSSTLG